MMLQIIDIFYLVLIMFTTILGTLLTIILLRLMKVLHMATEVVDFYNKIKQIISSYKQIPSFFTNKIKETMKK